MEFAAAAMEISAAKCWGGASDATAAHEWYAQASRRGTGRHAPMGPHARHRLEYWHWSIGVLTNHGDGASGMSWRRFFAFRTGAYVLVGPLAMRKGRRPTDVAAPPRLVMTAGPRNSSMLGQLINQNLAIYGRSRFSLGPRRVSCWTKPRRAAWHFGNNWTAAVRRTRTDGVAGAGVKRGVRTVRTAWPKGQRHTENQDQGSAAFGCSDQIFGWSGRDSHGHAACDEGGRRGGISCVQQVGRARSGSATEKHRCQTPQFVLPESNQLMGIEGQHCGTGQGTQVEKVGDHASRPVVPCSRIRLAESGGGLASHDQEEQACCGWHIAKHPTQSHTAADEGTGRRGGNTGNAGTKGGFCACGRR